MQNSLKAISTIFISTTSAKTRGKKWPSIKSSSNVLSPVPRNRVRVRGFWKWVAPSVFFLSSIGPLWQRFGIDASEFALCRARKRVPEAHLTVSDAAKLPFKGAFDIIVAFDVLEHIMELETIPENIASKLNPGGYFIFVVPVYDGPTGPIIRKLDHDTTHRHKRSRFFWLAWVSSHFTVCQWQGVFRYLFPFGGYLHVPTKLLNRLR